MKCLLTILFLLNNFIVQAQKPVKCNCRTKEGVNSVTVEGTIKDKGKSKLGHRYDLNVVFENQTKCLLKVESVLVGSTVFQINNIVLDTKNSKKNFKKSFIISKMLDTELGLDDDLFVNLVVNFQVNNIKCSHEYTVLYKDLGQK